MCNICYQAGKLPEDWKKDCIVPVYKGNGSKLECKNYTGIRLLGINENVYRMMYMERVVNETAEKISQEQCGVWRGRVCVDHISALHQLK